MLRELLIRNYMNKGMEKGRCEIHLDHFIHLFWSRIQENEVDKIERFVLETDFGPHTKPRSKVQTRCFEHEGVTEYL